MSKVTHRDIRQGIVKTCREMNRIGLNQGTSGNLSHRIADGMLITPTSLPYDDMGPKDIVEMAFDGSCSGRHRPSSEWRFHRDILKARADVNVVLHTHSTYATTLAVHGKSIPAFHYMVAVGGGIDVRCSPYACFGTQDLSDHALAALDGRLACLLGHHGLIVLADTFEKALWRAVEIETLAKMYVHALAIGEPPRLTRAQMTQVFRQMKRMSYGQAPRRPEASTGDRDAASAVTAAPESETAPNAATRKPKRQPGTTDASPAAGTKRSTSSAAAGPTKRKSA
jgi:L-fuculose-phosphate aldolase